MSQEKDQEEQQELFDPVEGDFQDVPLDQVQEVEDHDAAIGQSIETFGGVSTPVLRHDPDYPDRPFRIVDGRRRITALRAGDTDTVHAFVVANGFNAEANALTAVLNIVRKPNAIEEARSIAELVDAGYTPESLSRIGIPKQTTKKRLRLWNAPDTIKAGVEQGEISEGVAEKVANMSPDLQERAVTFFEDEGKLRHKDLREIRRVGLEEEVEDMGDDLFDTPDVDRSDAVETASVPEEGEDEGAQEERPSPGERSPLDTGKDSFREYIRVAGVVNEYFNPEGGAELTTEEVIEMAVDTGGRLDYDPDDVLAILNTPPSYFLHHDVIKGIKENGD